MVKAEVKRRAYLPQVPHAVQAAGLQQVGSLLHPSGSMQKKIKLTDGELIVRHLNTHTHNPAQYALGLEHLAGSAAAGEQVLAQ